MRQQSKFGNVRTAYNGRTFSSKREANHAATLDALRFAKELKERVVSYECQYRMPLVVNEEKIADYYADFRVEFADGRIEIQDVKSSDGIATKTDVYRLKKKLVHALYGIEIVEI